MRCRMLVIVAVSVAALASALNAQSARHTLVVLSHSNHTVYEIEPETGAVVHEFVAPDQPHEAAISPDGGTVFASVPAASFVAILDAKTFKEKGRIETEFFKRPPLPRTGRNSDRGPLPPE